MKGYLRFGLLALLLGVSAAIAGASSSLQWTWDNPQPSGGAFKTLAFGNGIYVAAGEDRMLYSSTDGITWSAETGVLDAGGTYWDVIYAHGRFVLAGEDSTGQYHLASSTDGKTWTGSNSSLPTAPDDHLDWLTDSLLLNATGKGYLATNYEHTFTSTDGKIWTVRDDSTVFQAACIPTVCIRLAGAPGSDGDEGIYYSTDGGATWIVSPSIADSLYYQLASDGSTLFVYDVERSRIGFSMTVYSSTDGIRWSTHTGTADVSFLDGPSWDGSGFVAIGVATTALNPPSYVFTSPDGINWTQGATTTAMPALSGHGTVLQGGTYLSAMLTSAGIQSSTDLATWTPVFGGTGPSADIIGLAAGGGVLVAVGYSSVADAAQILESPDGSTWSTVYTGAAKSTLQGVVYGNGVFVATDGLTNWLSSTDGVTWNPITSPSPPTVLGHIPMFSNGSFVEIDPTCECMETSTDGQTWTNTAVSLPSDLTNIATNGTGFVGLGVPKSGTTATVYQSQDGITWIKVGGFSIVSRTGYGIVRGFTDGFIALGSTDMGNSCGPYPPLHSDCYEIYDTAVATSKDGVHWTATTINDGDLANAGLSDAVFDGHEYLALYSSFDDVLTTGVAASADGSQWCELAGFPSMASATLMLQDGAQTYVAGTGGQIVSTTTSAASSYTCMASTSTVVPPSKGAGGGDTGKGKSGSLDVLTLAALLGLALARRRVGPG